MAQHVVRAARGSLMWLLVAALAVTLLLMLERTGSSTAPAIADFSEGKITTQTHSSGNHDKHCTDGRGQDAVKNKNCQISHG